MHWTFRPHILKLNSLYAVPSMLHAACHFRHNHRRGWRWGASYFWSCILDDVKLSKRCKQKWRICINARLMLRHEARSTSLWHRLHSGTEWVSVFSSGIWLPFGIWSALQFTCGCFWEPTHSGSRKELLSSLLLLSPLVLFPLLYPMYNWICALRVHQALHLFCNYSTRA